MGKSKKLIECETFFELEEMLNGLELTSSALAGKIRYYRNSHKVLLIEGDVESMSKHGRLLKWLEKYKDLYSKGYKVLDCKELAISYLLEDKSVVEVKRLLEGEGFKVSRTTLYKYKKGIGAICKRSI